ncbi:melanoma antigen preferentially expressed in tumors-like [Orycteropus afer afer]|uniref:Melanoma antigen preferentially expressed in tumors-like n=1 Tax=Orycteropus afer afer TaxID=1230840 RepID=A0AC54ZC93_ORYAF|nr:melanoma antigen preferentially expressed in tumors-like [Orycteropus afer afer]
MNRCDPPRLLDFANQSLLQDESSAIAALEVLPTELFPPLFMAAVAGTHSETVKAMVQAWPFTCLPLGALMKAHQPHQDILTAALDGLAVLLEQKDRPRRWKLKVLDLRTNTHTNFWKIWSGPAPKDPVCSSKEPEAAQPNTKRRKVDNSRAEEKQNLVPVEVLTDLCFRQVTSDEFLSFLMKRVKQKKHLPHLCCRKLEFVDKPPQIGIMEKILNMMQLDCVQEVRVKCSWDLLALAWFAPYLGQMVNLSKMRLSGIIMNSWFHQTAEEEDMLIAQFTSQFLHLRQLQYLHLDSVLSLEGHLDQVFRFLKTPLKTLWITNCFLSELDLSYLPLCASTSHLKSLRLSEVMLTSLNPDFLQVLLERASATLQVLDLSGCGITDSQLSTILPALGQCSQLIFLRFCGNPVSKAGLESLLRHTLPLCEFKFLEIPVPLECYRDIQEEWACVHICGNSITYLGKRLLDPVTSMD